MTANFPPDNYREVGNTVWGTDVDRDETASEGGGFALDFLAVATPSGGSKLENITEIPVKGSTAYYISARINAAANAGGQAVQMTAVEYDDSGTQIGSQDIFLTNTVGTGAYETLGGSIETMAATRGLRLQFGKNASFAPPASVLYDQIQITESPDYAWAELSSAEAIAATTWSPLTNLAEPTISGGGVFAGSPTTPEITLSAGVFTVRDPGIYQVNFAAEFQRVVGGQRAGVRCRVWGGTALVPRNLIGGIDNMGLNTEILTFSQAVPVPVPNADIIPQVFTSAAADVLEAEVTIVKID